ncbi:MAG TPA: acyltransferase, partial [Mycobacteriales bacterium]
MRHGEAPSTSSGRVAPLDGVRAVAIVVVMAYHSGTSGLATGGFYGQDAFFVLSGLLITSLLLQEGGRRRGIDLLAFWGRRIRRLLPALLVLLVAVDLYVTYVAPPGRYPGFTGDARSTVFYVANWHLISASSNYFAVTGYPSLLTHTWSLAIEEQFYLVWPLVLLLVVWLLRGRPHRASLAVLAVSVAGALASAGWMAYLYTEGASASRLYYGSDTHAQCLLVGAALAAGLRLAARRPHPGLFPTAHGRRRRWLLSAAGWAGAAGLCWLWTHVSSASPFAYEGGFLCVALCTAAVLVSVTAVPQGLLARGLGWRPIAFVGLISYGMYLWYFPTFALITSAHTGLRSWPLLAVRSLAVFALAVVS